MTDELKHFGVKGMRWGRRKKSNSNSLPKKTGKIGMIKKSIKSAKRESDWRKTLAKAEGMTTKELQTLANRVRLENEFKQLARTPRVGTKGDRKAYLDRDKISDKDLATTVERLRAKNQLNDAVGSARRQNIETGKQILETLERKRKK